MKNELKYYYLKTLTPFFGFLGLFTISQTPWFEATLFLFGYIWTVAFHTPYLRERSQEHKYRYSFIRLFYYLHKPCLSYFPQKWAIPLTLTFILTLWMALLNLSFMHVVFPVLGSLCWAPKLLKLKLPTQQFNENQSS